MLWLGTKATERPPSWQFFREKEPIQDGFPQQENIKGECHRNCYAFLRVEATLLDADVQELFEIMPSEIHP